VSGSPTLPTAGSVPGSGPLPRKGVLLNEPPPSFTLVGESTDAPLIGELKDFRGEDFSQRLAISRSLLRLVGSNRIASGL